MGKARTPKTKPAEPTEVVVRYDLFDLPTAFHKAGLAGLLMLVESLKTRKVLTSEEARYETSATAATVTVPERVAPPGFAPSAIVMLPVKAVTSAPNASLAWTVTAGAMLAPATTLLGCTTNASCCARLPVAVAVTVSGFGVGFVLRMNMDPALAVAVFRASPGQVVGPVKTARGAYELAQVHEVRRAELDDRTAALVGDLIFGVWIRGERERVGIEVLVLSLVTSA